MSSVPVDLDVSSAVARLLEIVSTEQRSSLGYSKLSVLHGLRESPIMEVIGD